MLLLVHDHVHPDHGGRLLGELQEEVLHRVHTDKVGPDDCSSFNSCSTVSVEETIEKCYHPMERLCAPPAYGEEPAEVFTLIFIKNTHDILVYKMYRIC